MTPNGQDLKSLLSAIDHFEPRHIGPSSEDQEAMLKALGVPDMDSLIDQVVPASIRMKDALKLRAALTESEALRDMRELAEQNQVWRSYIGMGYYGTLTPSPILRHVLENPGWYTQYTPYQAEISQGRLEALLNFQTMVTDLTGLPIANSSMLDEGTAAAEAMTMCLRVLGRRNKARRFFADQRCHPQTLAILKTRAEPLDIELFVGRIEDYDFSTPTFGVLVQYPCSTGEILDIEGFLKAAHDHGALNVVATDLLALTLLKAPAALGADVAVGNSQRLGVPMGYGGPHAAFMASSEDFKRQLPGRIVGVSKDRNGQPALRLALQTREQHIRRDRATSNICTAQVLLAVMASMYGVYHGPEGLKRIATRVRLLTALLAKGLRELGYELPEQPVFDTLHVRCPEGAARRLEEVHKAAAAKRINLRSVCPESLALSLDETVSLSDLNDLYEVFGGQGPLPAEAWTEEIDIAYSEGWARSSEYMSHPVFHSHHSETHLLRYIHTLVNRDLSLTSSMIPLGSCTMKLNATTELMPVSWPGFGALHPFIPESQAQGYAELFRRLEADLAELTGFAAVSLQPNAGSQGEYAGLLTIRAYHHARGQGQRDICLIPTSAHGTNPASAVMVGLRVVGVKCDEDGNIDVEDLRAKAEKHKDKLSALMVTYPSTHGVFEEGIVEICQIIHEAGGQVYLDGANMNALVGLCQPAGFGADVCHLNLHKTFCLAKGTPVRLAEGLSLPIEQLAAGQQVSAWSKDAQGVVGANLTHHFKTGLKDCVQVTLSDGRQFTCTPDHRVLTTRGWVEASELCVEAGEKVVVGPDSPLDDRTTDLELEQSFEMSLGELTLSTQNPEARANAQAFFRLLGALSSDGSYCETDAGRRRIARLNFGTRRDALKALVDIERLTDKRPTISKSRSIFSIRLPVELVQALEEIPDFFEPGKRVDSKARLPQMIRSRAVPKCLRREFFGALFGGDGVAPSIVYLRKNPNTLKELRFVQTRTDKAVLKLFLQDICEGLGDFGVEAYIGKINEVEVPSDQVDQRQRWFGTLGVVWGTQFSEQIGFRYCTHKTARLTAATAWWRLKETVLRQRREVAKRALSRVAAAGSSHRGPKRVWDPAVEGSYEDLSREEPVLNEHFAGFKGHDRILKQHLEIAIHGNPRKDKRGLRRSHRRAVLPANSNKGEKTGMPSLEEFFEEMGVSEWFNSYTPRGESYSVTYATESQDSEWSPCLQLRVIDVRAVGQREVFDLTVQEHHNFLANGVVVHNCIPHGGGGPGMGPICVAEHLKPYLPGHHTLDTGIGPVSAAAYGSAGILPISYAYIVMMGPKGLKHATEVAILSANYIAERLNEHFPVLYRGGRGRVAHECIIDLRDLKKSSGVEVEDVCKRLMDYGFHAPTQSWPVAGTLMIEPTESESLDELERFCEALISIRGEIAKVESGEWPRDDNPLKNAPHTASDIASEAWDHPYTREQAAFPAAWVTVNKFWPAVARIDNVYGDRNLVCACPSVLELSEA